MKSYGSGGAGQQTASARQSTVVTSSNSLFKRQSTALTTATKGEYSGVPAETRLNAFNRNQRKCTDVGCAIVFLLFLAGLLALSSVALQSGDPYKLLYPTDSKGRYCSGFTPYANYLDPVVDLKNSSTNETVFRRQCVATCPTVIIQEITPPANQSTTATPGTSSNTTASTTGATSTAPTSAATSTTSAPAGASSTTTAATTLPPAAHTARIAIAQSTARPALMLCLARPTTKEEIIAESKVLETLPLMYVYSGDIFRELLEHWWSISLCGIAMAVGVSYFIIFILKSCPKVFMWLVVLATLTAMTGAALFCASRGGYLTREKLQRLRSGSQQNSQGSEAASSNSSSLGTGSMFPGASAFDIPSVDQQYKIYYQVGTWVMVALIVLFIAVSCRAYQRVKLAVDVLVIANQVINAIPSMMVFPFLPAVIISIFLCLWLTVSAYILSLNRISVSVISQRIHTIAPPFTMFGSSQNSSTTLSSNSTSSSPTAHRNTSHESSTEDMAAEVVLMAFSPPSLEESIFGDLRLYMFCYHLIGLYWIVNFLLASLSTANAATAAGYFWSKQKKTGRVNICTAYYWCYRYHPGSLAIGSFVVGIVGLFGAPIRYIDKKTKDKDGCMALLRSCFGCCLHIYSNWMKHVDNCAYAIIGMKGRSFCTAAKESYALRAVNLHKVGTVRIVVRKIMLLAITISTGSCCAAMYFWHSPNPNEVSLSLTMALLVVAILSFSISSLLIGIFTDIVDTMLICACEDERINRSKGVFYTSDELREYLAEAPKYSFEEFKLEMERKALI